MKIPGRLSPEGWYEPVRNLFVRSKIRLSQNNPFRDEKIEGAARTNFDTNDEENDAPVEQYTRLELAQS